LLTEVALEAGSLADPVDPEEGGVADTVQDIRLDALVPLPPAQELFSEEMLTCDILSVPDHVFWTMGWKTT
jgi:hypothetical protein